MAFPSYDGEEGSGRACRGLRRDAPLHRTARYFPAEELRASYRLPLPPEIYRIALGFAETSMSALFPRTFDVRIEGDRALEAFDPMRAGFATAQVCTFVRPVTDGFLDIEFGASDEDPCISTIEVERVE